MKIVRPARRPAASGARHRARAGGVVDRRADRQRPGACRCPHRARPWRRCRLRWDHGALYSRAPSRRRSVRPARGQHLATAARHAQPQVRPGLDRIEEAPKRGRHEGHHGGAMAQGRRPPRPPAAGARRRPARRCRRASAAATTRSARGSGGLRGQQAAVRRTDGPEPARSGQAPRQHPVADHDPWAALSSRR